MNPACNALPQWYSFVLPTRAGNSSVVSETDAAAIQVKLISKVCLHLWIQVSKKISVLTVYFAFWALISLACPWNHPFN